MIDHLRRKLEIIERENKKERSEMEENKEKQYQLGSLLLGIWILLPIIVMILLM
jgi:hypothetical protein